MQEPSRLTRSPPVEGHHYGYQSRNLGSALQALGGCVIDPAGTGKHGRCLTGGVISMRVGGRGQERETQGRNLWAGEEEALEGRVSHVTDLQGSLCLQETSWASGSACSMA